MGSYNLHPRNYPASSWSRRRSLGNLSKPKRPKMQFSVLSIFSVLVTSTIGRPRIESSNSMRNVISNNEQQQQPANIYKQHKEAIVCVRGGHLQLLLRPVVDIPEKRKMLRTQQLPWHQLHCQPML